MIDGGSDSWTHLRMLTGSEFARCNDGERVQATEDHGFYGHSCTAQGHSGGRVRALVEYDARSLQGCGAPRGALSAVHSFGGAGGNGLLGVFDSLDGQPGATSGPSPPADMPPDEGSDGGGREKHCPGVTVVTTDFEFADLVHFAGGEPETEVAMDDPSTSRGPDPVRSR